MGESAKTKDIKAHRSPKTANGFIDFDRVNAVRGQSSKQPATYGPSPTVTTEQVLTGVEDACGDYETPESAKVVRFPFSKDGSDSPEGSENVATQDDEGVRTEESTSADPSERESLESGGAPEDALAPPGAGEGGHDREASKGDAERVGDDGSSQGAEIPPHLDKGVEEVAREPLGSRANDVERAQHLASEVEAPMTPAWPTLIPPSSVLQTHAAPSVPSQSALSASPGAKRSRSSTVGGCTPSVAAPVPRRSSRLDRIAIPGRVATAAEAAIFLRIGISCEMHARLVAVAKMSGLSSTQFARDLLEQYVPVFRSSASLSELARTARDAFPSARAPDAQAETRMQVPLSEDLYRRVHQLAALRSQTLKACMMDLLEAHVPEM